MITVAQLVACGIGPTQARQFADPLSAVCALHAIDTPNRKAAFIGQCAHESARFTMLEENLYYTKPERVREMFPSRVTSLGEAAKLIRNPKALANRVYSERLGNGDEASGDGWRFIGRGIIQLTGRANYMAAGLGCKRPYKEQPELVREPSDACLTAAWFWSAAGLNFYADSWQIHEVTRRVNGPKMADRDMRLQLSEQARQAFA